MAADPSEHVAQAKLLIAERRYQDAVRALRRALVAKPDHIEARLLLGTALLALERYDEVRAEMVALSRKAPKDARVQRLLGEAFLRGGKSEKAVEALRRALELDPDDEPARELLAEAGEEVPPRSRTMERWFDPEQVATIQTNSPEFIEDATGPHAVVAELASSATSVLVDPAFQRAIDEAGSNEITSPPARAPRRSNATLLGLPSPLAPPAQPAPPARSKKATMLGMPAVLPPAALPLELSTTEIPLPIERPSYAPPRPGAPPVRLKGFAPPATRAAPASPPARPIGKPPRRDVTEQLDLGELEDMASSESIELEDAEHSSSIELETIDSFEDSTNELRRPPVVAAPAPMPAPLPSRPSVPPPPAVASSSVAGPPARSFAPAPAPALPAPSFPPPSFPPPSRLPTEAYPLPPFGAPPPYTDTTNQERTNVHVPSPRKKKSSALPIIAAGVAAALLVLGLTTVGVRSCLASNRADEIAALVAAADADGRSATLEAAISALTKENDDDPESIALLARLEAVGVLEQGRDPTRANALSAELHGDDAQLPNALLARAYLLLARGEIDGARRAAVTVAASDELAAEAAHARALTALAAGDLTRAVAEARVSAAATPSAARPSALLATLLTQSGDAAAALSTLESVTGGSVSPAVRLARARTLLARDGRGDLEAAAREAAEVLGPLAATATPFERAGAHLVQAELAVAAGDLARATTEVRAAQPAPVDEGFGLAKADVLAATGAATEARAVLTGLPPTSTDPRRRARVAATVALALNDLAGAETAVAQAGEGGGIDLLRGRIEEARGRTTEAQALYERVPVADAAMPAARTRLATLLLDAGRARQALEALQPASDRLPTDVEVTALLARIRLALRDFVGARAAIERALNAGVRSPRLLAMKAEIELADGHPDAALITLQSAISLAPSDATLQVTLARAQRQAGHATEARAAVDAALRLDPSSSSGLLVLADLCTDGGDVDGANAAITRAEATGHASAADVARARVRVLVATGAGAGGVAAADAIAQASRDASLYVALGRLHAQAEQGTEAADAFGRALRLDPRDPDAWVGKVFLAIRRGDMSGASRGLTKAVELADARNVGPELRARIETARGRLRFESGDFTGARERAQAALALDSRSAEAHLLLANVATELGGDPVPELRAAVAGVAPPAEAIGLLAQRLPRGDEACAAARRYLDAAPHGYDADAVRAVADRCR